MVTTTRLRYRVLVNVLGFGVLCGTCFGITIITEDGPVRLTPGGPRAGPVYGVEVNTSSKEDMIAIAAEGFNVAYVGPDCVRVYAVAKEVDWL